MDTQVVQIEDRGELLLITINRPVALNALNNAVMDALHEIFVDERTKLKGTKGIIITGSGAKSFVAGADIKEFKDLNEEQGSDLSAKGHDIFNAIEQCPVPVIAAINGLSLGGGNELAMACHLRIAGRHAKFGQPEVKLGLTPGYAGTQRLVDLVGRGRALELLMTGKMIDAEEALAMGLVNSVVPSGEEVDAAVEMCNSLSANAPLAIAEVISLVNMHKDKGADAYTAESSTFGELMETEDFAEGTSAFVEKRKANFKGK